MLKTDKDLASDDRLETNQLREDLPLEVVTHRNGGGEKGCSVSVNSDDPHM
jgi:hypothetical protein